MEAYLASKGDDPLKGVKDAIKDAPLDVTHAATSGRDGGTIRVETTDPVIVDVKATSTPVAPPALPPSSDKP